MNSISFRKIGAYPEFSDEQRDAGIYPLFGFAVSDFFATGKFTRDEVSDDYIFGAILDDYDFSHVWDLYAFIGTLVASTNTVRMLIFDINAVTDSDIASLKEWFKDHADYYELENVYDGRVVFVKRG